MKSRSDGAVYGSGKPSLKTLEPFLQFAVCSTLADMGANTRFRFLSDYIRHKANVRAKCRCGHVGVVDAEKFRRG